MKTVPWVHDSANLHPGKELAAPSGEEGGWDQFGYSSKQKNLTLSEIESVIQSTVTPLVTEYVKQMMNFRAYL
jgi:hypothetical protein